MANVTIENIIRIHNSDNDPEYLEVSKDPLTDAVYIKHMPHPGERFVLVLKDELPHLIEALIKLDRNA